MTIRLRACWVLGITDYPKVIRAGKDEDEKDEHAILLNVSRRNLTPEQKIEIAETLKTRHPKWPVTKIAKMLHMDDRTLSGQLPDFRNLTTLEGADGKIRLANKEAIKQKRK